MPIVTFDTSAESAEALTSKKMDLEAGWLGKCFGAGRQGAVNIAGATVILLLLSGFLALFIKTEIPAADYWKVISPIITLALGYTFGAKSD